MPKPVFIVAYGGEDRTVVNLAATHARKEDAKLHLVHVLEWSPYSFLTPQELEERHARRKKELARAEEAVMAPVLGDLRAAGVEADGEILYGSTVELILEVTREQGATLIFVGRSEATLGARVFGSVSIGLAQAAPVPTVIVP
ncbi:MAG: universal stress protein [Alphaproteobacteria bacterium HGW-Alphaproteobacteria-8]|nr:MAG: universal stress protein [Alphaproteobacteria bacterium HGW-Alphaproteobacteria-8]